MFNAYTPLQYIEPNNAPQQAVPAVQYASAPVNYACPVEYKPSIVKGYIPARNIPPVMPMVASVQPAPMVAPVQPTPVATVTPVVAPQVTPIPMMAPQMAPPSRVSTAISRMSSLDNGWSDTNQVRIDNNLRIVSFEFVESTINVANRSINTSKSDEIANPYNTAEDARTIVDAQLDKVSAMPSLNIRLKLRSPNESFVRVLFDYVRDIDANTFYSFNGYLTIYSDSDDELDLISDLLNSDFGLNPRLEATPVNMVTPNNTPVSVMSQKIVVASTPVTVSSNTPVTVPANTPVTVPANTQVVSTPGQTLFGNNPQVQYIPTQYVPNTGSRFSPRAMFSDFQ